MNKAFIFDMDGVLVDSEPVWKSIEREYFPELFGKNIADKMPDLVGAGIEGAITLATSLGAVFDRNDVIKKYDEMARRVYAGSPITPGTERLVEKLENAGFKLGIVSQSPQSWIDQVIPRLSFKNSIKTIVSIQDAPHLKRKPAPDGYTEVFRALNSLPENSFVLEDSNLGIQAGKAAGAYTIGYRGNLVSEYEQAGADAYADTMDDVIAIVGSFPTQP